MCMNLYVYKLYTYINYNIGATYLTGDTPEIQDNNRFGIKPSDFIEALVALALDRGLQPRLLGHMLQTGSESRGPSRARRCDLSRLIKKWW